MGKGIVKMALQLNGPMVIDSGSLIIPNSQKKNSING